MSIRISDDKFIGENHLSYIIVDVGANHNGDFQTVENLIISAAKMGADAINFFKR